MSKQKHWFVAILNYTIDYAPIIATLIAATVASLAAIRKTITTDEILQWILVVLALLATTQLIDRFRLMRSIESKIDNVSENIHSSAGISSIFVHRMPAMEERLREAKSISILGITLVRTTDSFWGVFKRCFARDGKIRLIIVDPNHSAIEVASKRFHKHHDVNSVRREAEHTLDNLTSLMTQPNAVKGLQIGLTQIVPAYGIWMIDVDTPKAEIWVELYSYRAEPEPTFQLLPHRDGEWFNYFKEQFEMIWKDSQVWQPASITAKLSKT